MTVIISKERLHHFYRSKDFTPEYLVASPRLKYSLETGIKIALSEEVTPSEMVINGTYTGVLQGALDAIAFFREEIDEHPAIAHIAKLLINDEITHEKALFVRTVDYVGASLVRRSPALGWKFAHNLIDLAAEREDGFLLRLLIGMESTQYSNYQLKSLLPTFESRADVGPLIKLIGENQRFGELCVKNALTSLIRYVKSPIHKGKLLEIALGL